MRTSVAGIVHPFEREEAARAKLPAEAAGLVAGVDEAGRGPLAGPVVVAAVILPRSGFSLPVNDSKKLTERQRQELARALKADPSVHYAIVQRSAAEIDRMNILRATQDAMREAVLRLAPQPEFVLVDGLAFAPFPFPVEFLVKGDSRSASIAAASILAKTARDEWMTQLEERYPGYGFAKHKGYGTAEHLEALNRLGPCPEHRRSFAPVAQPAFF